MRAYLALLAITMKVLKAVEQNPDLDLEEQLGDNYSSKGRQRASAVWDKLPGSISWDFATGSEGNIINRDLINLLGARTLARLRSMGSKVFMTSCRWEIGYLSQLQLQQSVSVYHHRGASKGESECPLTVRGHLHAFIKHSRHIMSEGWNWGKFSDHSELVKSGKLTDVK